MSIDDESAAARAAEDDPDLNPDGTVGVGTDGSLVSEPDELTDQAADNRDAHDEPR